MKLVVTQLIEGESSFHFSSEKDAWIRQIIKNVREQGSLVNGDLKLDVQVTKLDPDYYLRGKMAFEVEQNCARCAETFPLEINHGFAVALAQTGRGKAATPKLSEESDELDVHFFEGHEIDLAPIAQEQIFLSLPYQSLCGQECKGVCQKCGTNLNQSGCGCPATQELNPFSVLQKYQA